MENKKIEGSGLLILAVLITVAVFLMAPFLKQFEALGYFGAFIISLINSATVLLPAPGWAIIIGMGRALDPVLLGIVAGIGAGIGELTGYLAGKGGEELLEGKIDVKAYKTQKKWLESHSFATVFVLAAIPNPFFDIAGMTAGALRMPVWKFLLACILGKIVKFVVLAEIGALSLIWF